MIMTGDEKKPGIGGGLKMRDEGGDQYGEYH